VREDKVREAGVWLRRHLGGPPDLVRSPRRSSTASWASVRTRSKRKREDVQVKPDRLLDFTVPAGRSPSGLRNNVSVALQYLASCLTATGAVAIFNLMEDAPRLEISRSQVWQWQRNGIRLAEGRR